MKILFLSAYDAVSHKHWREGLTMNINEHEWTELVLPPRFFSWRVRGNSLSWAFGERETLSRKYDLVFATSMTDIASLRGFIPSLAEAKTIIYFHENQFAYPDSRSIHSNVDAKMVNLYSALCADIVLFNTDYNRKAFFDGLKKFLKKMPDFVPEGVVEKISECSGVAHVPIKKLSPLVSKRDVPVILWNHRWEYDKAPERFFAILKKLRDKGFKFGLNIVGQQFRESPEVFEEIKSKFSEEIIKWGYVESREEYEGILRDSDMIVSTAIHDFQGLAVLEAVDAGCIPVLPDRLAYPEFFDSRFLYQCGTSIEKEAEIGADKIIELWGEKPTLPSLEYLYWENYTNVYKEVFQKLFNA